jgi:Ca2+-binding RTX toxin-like protein
VNGTSGDYLITIYQDETSSYAPLKNLILNFNGNWEYFDASKVKSILIDSGNGNDSVEVSVNVPATINGGNGDDDLTGPNADALLNGEAGNDRITGGSANDTLLGGAGADSLNGGNGADVIDGESGNDTIVGLSGADTCFGGPGIDALDCSQMASALSIKLDNTANDGTAGEKANVHSDIEAILGGGGNDLLIASSANTLLDGGPGNDTLWGGVGDDTLFGDAGNDEFHAKDGYVDTVNGGDGTDKASVDQTKTESDVVSNVELLV